VGLFSAGKSARRGASKFNEQLCGGTQDAVVQGRDRDRQLALAESACGVGAADEVVSSLADFLIRGVSALDATNIRRDRGEMCSARQRECIGHEWPRDHDDSQLGCCRRGVSEGSINPLPSALHATGLLLPAGFHPAAVAPPPTGNRILHFGARQLLTRRFGLR
jgi:hypothetical protein